MPKRVSFNLINKHARNRCRLTSVGHVTCVVTTEDGVTLYVYVTIYAAIHCKDKSGRDSRLNPALLIAVSLRSVIMPQKKGSPISKYTTSANTEDDATKFLTHTSCDFTHLRYSTQSIKCCLLTLFFTSPRSISDRTYFEKRKKVDLYKTFDPRWRMFSLRKMDERFHHPFTCFAAGPTSCG